MEIKKEKHKVYILNEKGKEVAYVTFPSIGDNVVVIDHTFVDESLRGLGIANLLMESTYEVISSQHWKAKLECRYAQKWFSNHPLNQDILL